MIVHQGNLAKVCPGIFVCALHHATVIHDEVHGSRLKYFFKQKTAYEIMSGDWSSDVCSSD
eukprot:SAG25_NODE_11247_length_310_cov_0.388626_1_plen_60_part_10